MSDTVPQLSRLSEVLPEGSLFRVEPHPGTADGRQAVRYWLTEVADASRDPSDRPSGPDIFTLQRVGEDYLRLVQENGAHPAVILPLAACAFINL